jgi:salicylate hydroxylase
LASSKQQSRLRFAYLQRPFSQIVVAACRSELMSDKPLSIAIVGGGIGGLSAALRLLQAGFDVHVYEQARAISEIGAGIQISPNASRLLHRLGLAESMAEAGVRPLWRHQRRWNDGNTIVRAPLGCALEDRFGAPYYNFHRADLIAMLSNALPAERLHVGYRLAGFADNGSEVEVRFENGSTIVCDALVGADGIHSAVRTTLFGPEAPTFTGCVAYRGLVAVERLEGLRLPVEAQNWLGPGKHIVHYYVSSLRFVNVVCVIEQEQWAGESWTNPGEVADVLTAFEGWHCDVRTLIGAIDETFKWGLFDWPPLSRWSVGRVTLLGDSCHPMLPFAAQGAVQSIEDGATLAACLQGISRNSIEEALARYERLRLPRATRLQAVSRANETNFHFPDGPEQQARDARSAASANESNFESFAWLYDHDASTVN